MSIPNNRAIPGLCSGLVGAVWEVWKGLEWDCQGFLHGPRWGLGRGPAGAAEGDKITVTGAHNRSLILQGGYCHVTQAKVLDEESGIKFGVSSNGN